MNITAALIVYAIVWFMTFLTILPLRMVSQADMNDVVPGTPRGAPHSENVGRKALITTGVAFVIWAIIISVILFSGITVRDFDWMGRLPPLEG